MTKYITIKLTEDQVNHVVRGLGYTMLDYMEDYGGTDAIAVRNNKQADKENAFVQRLIDKILKQYREQS